MMNSFLKDVLDIEYRGQRFIKMFGFAFKNALNKEYERCGTFLAEMMEKRGTGYAGHSR